MKPNKENRRSLAAKVAESMNANAEYKHRNYSISEMEMIINTITAQIVETIQEGKEQTITGFGSFFLQQHHGHPVQFSKNGQDSITDYVTVKYSVSNKLSNQIRDAYRSGNAKACETAKGIPKTRRHKNTEK